MKLRPLGMEGAWEITPTQHAVRGAVFDVVVDLRVGSPTYGCNPASEHGVHPLDPELAINWPAGTPLLSARDQDALLLAEEARDRGLLPSYAACQALTALTSQ
ncbi:hypothetical protein [Streptomyces sp. NPDC020298]|uniref:hypothetical protein n=1 Tax=unclassified Streptomyces TaxID=2593676 RepID=UPI00340A1BA5